RHVRSPFVASQPVCAGHTRKTSCSNAERDTAAGIAPHPAAAPLGGPEDRSGVGPFRRGFLGLVTTLERPVTGLLVGRAGLAGIGGPTVIAFLTDCRLAL